MKIALVMEWSTSSKNKMVNEVLCKVAEKFGHEVVNYGQYQLEDHRMTYNQCAILDAVILKSGAADLVVTGCGTAEGACIAANAMPGVQCGLIAEPLDAYLFTQVNNGNCVALPFAKGFGWGGELNFEYMFERLFSQEWGAGYPEAAAASEQRNANILTDLKAVAHQSIEYILENADEELVRSSFGGKNTIAYLERDGKDKELIELVKKVIA